MRLMIAAVLSGLLVLGSAGAALAQPTADAADDTTGVFCVYNTLKAGPDAELVARVFLYDDTPEADIGRSTVVVNAAAEDCAKAHMLTASKAASAYDLGIYGSVIDFLSAQLRTAGVSKRGVSGVFKVFDGLEKEETERFAEQDWRSDIAFSGKLRKGVVAAGVPDKDPVIDNVFTLFEVTAMADQAIYQFLVDDL